MGETIDQVKKIFSGQIPSELIDILIEEYIHIKQQFFLGKYQPTELNGARFSECVLRILEHLNNGSYTALGTQLGTDQIIRSIENNTNQKDTLRIFIPRLVRVLLDVRNKRDVAHVGGEVNPNHSDSLFIIHSADWILTEMVRHFHNCPVGEAQKIVNDINELKIPIIANIDGFIRVQNTELSATEKVLVILYHKSPQQVRDTDLCKWTRYKNITNFKKKILRDLDDKVFIHYENGSCILLPKGSSYVEKNIPLVLLVEE